MSRPCPTDAAACCVAKSVGRTFNPNGASPAAMAPDETTQTSAPRARAAATTLTNFSTDAGSNCAPALPVSEEEPILITMRFAVVMSLRITSPPLRYSLQ